MTYLLDDLEAAGLIERRPDPADRRARHVIATRRGTKLLATLDAGLQTAEAQLLTPLDPTARESFRAQVRLLATHIDALDPLESPCDLADAVDAELPAPRRTVRSTRSR
jgi:DNA-binding MarR family transcriptional regulator